MEKDMYASYVSCGIIGLHPFIHCYVILELLIEV